MGFLLSTEVVEHDRRLLQSAEALRALRRPDAAERRCRQALHVNPRRQVPAPSDSYGANSDRPTRIMRLGKGRLG